MKTFFLSTAAFVLYGFQWSQAEDSQNWPQWRGPFSTGQAAPDADPPISWDENHNIKWKTWLPGLGHSTPVVWGDHIFLTTAIPTGEKLPPKYSGAPGAHDNSAISQEHEFVVIAIDRQDGKILWQTKVHQALPHEGAHVSASLASASPVTDGKQVYAFFGSYGLYALDFDDEVVEGTIDGVLELHPKGYGFLRSAKKNYVAQESDPFVPSSLVEKYRLREGVEIRGDVGPGVRNQGPRLKEVELIDGLTPDEYDNIKDFDELTPITPHNHVLLETGPKPITMRVMDLLTPIGRGQRALLVAPPRTGKTMLLQDIADAVSQK